MSIDHLLTIPCSLIRRTYSEDANAEGGQDVTEDVTTTVCELQGAGSREEQGGAVQITTYRLWLPSDTPLRGWDAVALESGEILELEGDAFHVRSPLTGISHVEAVVRRTDYGEPDVVPTPPVPLEAA